jgi:hypothetical protein
MLNTLKRNSWWLAITLAGVYQQGSAAPGAAVIVTATLLKVIAHAIWHSLPQRRRDQLAPSRAGITVPLRKSQANNQEHHHAYQ